MLPSVFKTATAAVTALSLTLATMAPAQALGRNEENFLKGVAATLLITRLLQDAQRRAPAPQPVYPRPVYPQPTYPRPVYQQPVYPQPVHPQPVHPRPLQPGQVVGGYTVPLYQTPAAQAFNAYSYQERRVIQQRLAQMGYYRSGIDATFGTGTYNAVVAYARDSGNSAKLNNRAGAFGVYDSLIY